MSNFKAWYNPPPGFYSSDSDDDNKEVQQTKLKETPNKQTHSNYKFDEKGLVNSFEKIKLDLPDSNKKLVLIPRSPSPKIVKPSKENNSSDPLRGVNRTDRAIRHKESTNSSTIHREPLHSQISSTAENSLSVDSYTEISSDLASFIYDYTPQDSQQTIFDHNSLSNKPDVLLFPNALQLTVPFHESDGPDLVAKSPPSTIISPADDTIVIPNQNNWLIPTDQAASNRFQTNGTAQPNLIASQSSANSSTTTENETYGSSSHNLYQTNSPRSNSTPNSAIVNSHSNILLKLKEKIWRRKSLEYLINPATHPNRDTTLIIAVRQGDVSQCDKLIKIYKQSNTLLEHLNWQNIAQETALSIAVHQNNLQTVETLIINGCDPSIPLVYGGTVCHLAAMKYCEAVVSQSNISGSSLLDIIYIIESHQPSKLSSLMRKRDLFGKTVEDILTSVLSSVLTDSAPRFNLTCVLSHWQLKLSQFMDEILR